MYYTTFDRTRWNINDFETIGYDKETMTLVIEFLSGETRTHTNVPEETVFQFVVSTDKETFYCEQISKQYPG